MTHFATSVRQRLTRVTSTGDFIPQIDGLRFLAVLLVFGHHVFANYLEQTHRLGAQSLPRDWGLIYSRSALVPWALDLVFGVPLFCAISGFVLSIPFASGYLKGAGPPSRKAYFLRRLIRLEPPYMIAMLVCFAATVIPWRQPQPAAYFQSYFHAFFPHLLASLAYLHAPIYGSASWINGIAWTLEIEVQFYILLPLLAQVFRIRRAARRRGVLIAAIFASALFAQYVVGGAGQSRLSLSLPVQLHFFLAGLLLADLYLDPTLRFLSGRVMDGLAVLAAVLLVLIVHREPQLAWAEPFLMTAFYFGVLLGTWASRLFRLPVLTVIGGMGYTIYLYHFFLIVHLLPITIGLFPPIHALWWDTVVQGLVLFPMVVVLSSLLFLAAERPFMIWSRRATRRVRQQAAVGVAA